MKPVEVLYGILCCLCLPCRRKTRGFGDKTKKARSTEVYNDRKVDMEKVYARLRKKRVEEVPSVLEIFPCQWNPESASRIKDGEKSVDYPLKGGCAQVGVFGRFKVQNVAEEIPPLVTHDRQLPAQIRNRRKRRQKKHVEPLDVDFTWDFGEEQVAGDIPRSEDYTCEMCAQPEIFAMKPKIELQDTPQEGRTEVRVIGRFNVTVVPEEVPPIQDDDCELAVETEITAKEPETEFVDLPREDPVEVDPADKHELRADSEEGAAKDPSSLASAAPSKH